MDKAIYTNGQRRVVEENDYKDFHYAIVSYGTHPCCYIKMDANHPMLADVEDEWDVPLSVHGGVTFCNELNGLDNLKEFGYYIGWDYAHLNDVYFYPNSYYTRDGKYWELDELRKEVENAIDEILEWEKAYSISTKEPTSEPSIDDYKNTPTSDLFAIVAEECSKETILSVAEGYIGERAIREFLFACMGFNIE